MVSTSGFNFFKAQNVLYKMAYIPPYKEIVKSDWF